MKPSTHFNALARQGSLLLLSLLMLFTFVSTLAVAGRAALADLRSTHARLQIDQLRSGKGNQLAIAEWGMLRNNLVEASQLTPQDPQLHEALGYLYANHAQTVARIPQLYGPFMRQASDMFFTAVRLRPMSGVTWANLALARHLVSSSAIPLDVMPMDESNGTSEAAGLWFAYNRAKLYGLREPGVQTTLDAIGTDRGRPSGLR